MTDPSRLTISVEHADGSTSRWSSDSPLVADMPLGLSFTTVLPGGFKDCAFNLPRLLTREYRDEALFDKVTVYGPGNQIAWKGRVQQLPREQGGRASVQVGCVGLSALLKDAAVLSEIYVDQDKSRWEEASYARKEALISGGYNPQSPTADQVPDTGVPSVTTAFAEPWGSPGLPISDAYYRAPGNVCIGSVYYAWTKSATIDITKPWVWYVGLSDNDAASIGNNTASLKAAGPGTGTHTATANTRKWARVALYYTAANASSTTQRFAIYWTALAVYGNHGLTLRGTGTSTMGPGVYASDVIRDVLARCAPSLPVKQIDDTTFIIPQLVFSGASAEDAILEVNKYHLYSWGVYEDGFFFEQNNEDNSTVYEARLSEGAQMSLEGDDAAETYNGVIVSYNDADGKPRVAAPPGVTYADYTSSDLLSSDPNNPATLHGLTRYGVLQITSPMPNTNSDGDNPAIQIGRMWLAEASLPQRRGSITLPALVRHPTEGLVPSWRVRAGDWIRIADRPSDVARRIVQTTYNYDSQTLTAEVGGLPRKVEALLEAVGVQMIGTA